MANEKILIVDDDRSVQAAMRAILMKAGYQVFIAMDAVQGTMMARSTTPDLIILDINMPAGGGYSVYERLQTLTGTMNIMILIYSVVAKETILEKIPGFPESRILTKPASPEMIASTVKTLLESSGPA